MHAQAWITLLGSAMALATASAAHGADVVVKSGTVVAATQSVGGSDHLTVEPDGTLAVDGTAINWDQPSTYLLIDNYGTVESTAAEGRAIDGTGAATAPRSLTLNNHAGGLITSGGDAIRIPFDITQGGVTVNNAGTIESTIDGEAIDFGDVDSTGTLYASITITNDTGGVVRARNADAVRPGQGALIINAGTIYSDGQPGDSHDAIDFESHSGSVTNLAGGTISGQRDGITTDTDVVVYNAAGGSIIGRNGSGVRSDVTGSVVNYGSISGDYVGAGNGSGNGVDIDGYGAVANYGTIRGTGAGGVDEDGRPNGSEGVAIRGGGSVVNHADATISGGLSAITAAGSTEATPFLIINDGTLSTDADLPHPSGPPSGEAYFSAIRAFSPVDITNTGTIDSSTWGIFISAGDSTVVNSGTITGGQYAIQFGSGNDTLVVLRGSVLNGKVDGGSGTNTLVLDDGATFGSATNFQWLEVNGAATVVGENDIATTTIHPGASLQMGDGGNAGFVNGAIADNGLLAIDRSDSTTIAAPISGTGAFDQAGMGTTTLNAANTFTGTTRVTRGALVIGDATHPHAAVAGAVSVAAGATLAGNGATGTLDVAGTIAPGDDSIGQLRVNGDATFGPGSAYVVDLGPEGTGDSIAIAGTLRMDPGSVVRVSPSSTPAAFTQYTIARAADGLVGRFDAAMASFDFLVPTLDYAGNRVALELDRNDVNFNSVATTRNQYATATAANGLNTTSPLLRALAVLDGSGVRAALDPLSGQLYASQASARVVDSRFVRDAMDRRLIAGNADANGQRLGDTQVTAWAQALGHWGSIDAGGETARLHASGAGATFGADVPIAGVARVGALGGVARDSISVRSLDSSARITSTWVGAYGGWQSGAWALRAGAAYAWDRIPVNRRVDFTGFSERLSSNTSGNTLTGFVEAAWSTQIGHGQLAPYANLANVRVDNDEATEDGGAAGLTAFGHATDVRFSTLGARASWQLGASAWLRADLGWQHAFGDVAPTARLRLADSQGIFTVSGAPLARDAATTTIGAAVRLMRHVTLDVAYGGQWSRHSNDQSARMGITARF